MFLQTLFPFPLITEVRSEGLSVNLWRLSACVIDGFWSHNRDHFCSPHSVIFPSFNTCGGWCLLYNLRLKIQLGMRPALEKLSQCLVSFTSGKLPGEFLKLWFHLLKLPLLKKPKLQPSSWSLQILGERLKGLPSPALIEGRTKGTECICSEAQACSSWVLSV